MPSVSVTWNTQKDDLVCPICRAMEAHTWTFTPQDPVPSQLTFNGKVVWDENQGSAAHQHYKNRARCRCHISTQFDLKDIVQKTEKLYAEVKDAYGSEPPR